MLNNFEKELQQMREKFLKNYQNAKDESEMQKVEYGDTIKELQKKESSKKIEDAKKAKEQLKK